MFVCAASGFWWPLPSAGANSAYAAHVNIPIDGTIDPDGCRIIGGEIVTDTIDYIEPSRSIELCNYHDKYHFKIVSYSACAAAIGYWTDPETGFTYTFSSICSAPRFYTEISCNSGSEVQVRTMEKPFYILLDALNSDCNSLEFNKSEKKITMIVNAHNQDNLMNVTIPSELLDGKFRLMIDRGSTKDFLVDNSQGYTTISFSKFCPNSCIYQVDIIGTEVTASELQQYLPPDDDGVPLIMNAKGERIEQPKAGQQVVVFGSYRNLNLQEAQPYVIVIEFRDKEGVTEFIAWQTGIADPDSFATAGVSWVPETKGEHEVRIFIISDLENPVVLSPVYSYGVFVV